MARHLFFATRLDPRSGSYSGSIARFERVLTCATKRPVFCRPQSPKLSCADPAKIKSWRADSFQRLPYNPIQLGELIVPTIAHSVAYGRPVADAEVRLR